MERGTTVWSGFVGTQPAPGGPFMAASVVESAREEGDRRRARAKHCTDRELLLNGAQWRPELGLSWQPWLTSASGMPAVGVQAGVSAALWAAAFSTVVTVQSSSLPPPCSSSTSHSLACQPSSKLFVVLRPAPSY
eukprot:SM003020S11644  [mRNA]  locus=s3020:142:546:- [translate_table: standard]